MGNADLSEFHAIVEERAAAQRKPNTCKVTVAAGELGDTDGALLFAAVGDVSITNRAVEAWADRRGVQLSWQAVRAHREGICSCPQ